MTSDQGKKTFVLKGIGVSPGIVIGKVYRFDPLDAQISFYKLNNDELIPHEIDRFKNCPERINTTAFGNSGKSKKNKSD